MEIMVQPPPERPGATPPTAPPHDVGPRPDTRHAQPGQAPAPAAGLAYHRLALADPRHRWWSPLVEIPLAGAVYLALSFALGLVWFAVHAGDSASARIELGPSGYPVELFTRPGIFLMTFLGIIVMLPAVLVGRLVMGPRPIGLILSAAGRLRWGWLTRCTGLAVAVFVAVQAAMMLLPVEQAETGAAQAGLPQTVWNGGTSLAILVMILLLVPVQCATEEVVFRGLPMQTLGRWLRHPAWAILLPVPVFVLGHGYDPWGQASVGVLAVVAGWLTWRTGGLEAAIGLHAANNVIGLGLGLIGWADPTASAGGAPGDLVVAVVVDGLYALLVVRLAQRRNLPRLRMPPMTTPMAPPPTRFDPIPESRRNP